MPCIRLPNGIRVQPRVDKDGNIVDPEYIRFLGEIPVEDLKAHWAGEETCIFIDNEPDKELSPKADAIRENLRNVLCEAVHHQGWPEGKDTI